MSNKNQWSHRTKQRKKTPQSTSESGFCNFNTDTVQINSSAHFGGEQKPENKRLKYTKKPADHFETLIKKSKDLEADNHFVEYHQESEGKITTSRIYPAPQNRQGRQKPLNRVRQKQQGL